MVKKLCKIGVSSTLIFGRRCSSSCVFCVFFDDVIVLYSFVFIVFGIILFFNLIMCSVGIVIVL